LGNIKKKGLVKDKLPKGDIRGVANELLRVIFFPTLVESLLFSSSNL